MDQSEQPDCKILVNAEGQYSLWPLQKDNPPGWADAGTAGTREECLSQIRRLWRDMRPISLRERE